MDEAALYDALGIYLALIVVFAIILARAESFASKHTLLPSFLDGLGMGVGFCVALVIIGILRELFGAGSIFGVKLLGDWYNAPLIMILPAGGFMLIGYLIGGWKMLVQHMEKKEAERSEA